MVSLQTLSSSASLASISWALSIASWDQNIADINMRTDNDTDNVCLNIL